MPRKVKTLDLFSGIGGFSLALSSICKTVGYCEVADYCKQILSSRMHEGKLDSAPIFDDINTITRADVEKLSPQMITAGFPCQDITTINRFGKGVDGERSKLVFEIFRLLVPSVKYILLENSSDIVNRGMDSILQQFIKLGWSVAWSVFSSLEVNAQHNRKRWICLACAPNAVPFTLSLKSLPFAAWRSPPRLAQSSESNTYRTICLGNAVIPEMIRHSYVKLCAVHDGTIGQSTNGPRSGLITNSGQKRLFNRECVHSSTPSKLIFNVGDKIYTKRYWATPTRRKPYHCGTNVPSLRHLTCQVILEMGTKKLKGGVLNCRFCEWLMMFPKDWTTTSRNDQTT